MRKSARSAENSGNPIKNGGKNQGFRGATKNELRQLKVRDSDYHQFFMAGHCGTNVVYCKVLFLLWFLLLPPKSLHYQFFYVFLLLPPKYLQLKNSKYILEDREQSELIDFFFQTLEISIFHYPDFGHCDF